MLWRIASRDVLAGMPDGAVVLEQWPLRDEPWMVFQKEDGQWWTIRDSSAWAVEDVWDDEGVFWLAFSPEPVVVNR